MWAIVVSIIIIVGLLVLVTQKYKKPNNRKTDQRPKNQVTDEDIEVEKIKSKRPPPGM